MGVTNTQQPFYNVLVSSEAGGHVMMTYVAQENIEIAREVPGKPVLIRHPAVPVVFDGCGVAGPDGTVVYEPARWLRAAYPDD